MRDVEALKDITRPYISQSDSKVQMEAMVMQASRKAELTAE